MTLPGSRLQQAALRVPPDPLLSVAMPVFNERTTIEEIIDRALAVKMRMELIVVDDVSAGGLPADLLQVDLLLPILVRHPG